MGKKSKKHAKVIAEEPKRQIRMTCLISESEQKIIDSHLRKYKITNKSRWIRETILISIHEKMMEDYPTLFKEHDMRR